MSQGMSKNVFNAVYKDREETHPKQSSYRDILLLEAEKTAKRKFELNKYRTVTIKRKSK